MTSLETARSLANDPSLLREKYVFCVPREWYCSVSYLSFVYGRSLWAELNAGKISLCWKANMLPLFSIMIYDFVFSSYAHLLCPKKQSTSSSNLHRLVIWRLLLFRNLENLYNILELYIYSPFSNRNIQ